jgi:hypothetical protein
MRYQGYKCVVQVIPKDPMENLVKAGAAIKTTEY